MTSNPIT